VVRLITTASPIVTDKTEDDFPAAACASDGTLWVAYISYTNRDESRRVEQQPFKEQPADFKKLYSPEFADQLFVKYYRDGSWSRPAAVTSTKEDLARCALGVDGDGKVWVAYSADRNGSFNLYARSLDLNTPEAVKNPTPKVGPEQRLTSGATPDITPVMCTD